MTYEERKCDLFSIDHNSYCLVHCISADFKLGAGIAKEFEKRFHLRDDLFNQPLPEFNGKSGRNSGSTSGN